MVFHGFSMVFHLFPNHGQLERWNVTAAHFAKSHHLETQRATGLDDQITCRGNQKKKPGGYDVTWM